MGVKNWVQAIRTCNTDNIEEADALTKFLIITRACVLPMTLTSVIIGGLFALIDGFFNIHSLWDWWLFIIVLVGITFAHMANNMINDYFDVKEGLDTEDYARAQYSPHPILSGLVSMKVFKFMIFAVNLVDFLIMIYLYMVRGLLVIVLALIGFFLSVFYVAEPIRYKNYGLGEISTLIVWGPLMIGGTYYILAGVLSLRVVLLSIPYGLLVMNVLVGKHVDKYEMDKKKGVKTLPVILGKKRGKSLVKLLIVLTYFSIVLLVYLNYLTAWALLTLLTLPRAVTVWKIFSIEKPLREPYIDQNQGIIQKLFLTPGLIKKIDFEPEEEGNWPIWPLWYVAWNFMLNRSIGTWFIIALIIHYFYPLDFNTLILVLSGVLTSLL
ncbi:MAG: prenyltransferase [Candidatus Njordarchaeia archaeon]